MKVNLFLILLLMTIRTSAIAQISNKITIEARSQTDYALKLCKYLHQNPELSFYEFETSKRMASELKKIGFEITENFAGNSVVGVYKNGCSLRYMVYTS